MCCLFGIIDYKGNLARNERLRIVRELANASEARGADATGIAYCKNNQLMIRKDHKPAHKMPVHIPRTVKVVLGHTRMTTQGSELENYNNHPFLGHCQNTDFALAHNGVLINDRALREEYRLPETRVQTDSYIAVQLLEQFGQLSLDSLGRMAETLVGSYNFTLLDHQENTYIVKGNNPFALYHFKKKGVYIYASTIEIARTAMKAAGLKCIPQPEKMEKGDILKITPEGTVSKSKFLPQPEYFDPDLSLLTRSEQYYRTLQSHRPMTEYMEWILDYAHWTGYPDEELLSLWEWGLSEEELEQMVSSGVTPSEIQQEWIQDLY